MPLALPQLSRQTGTSLIELMISVTIGLMVLAGLAAVFASSSAANAEIERANRQIENGRYAMQLLTDDLEHAGYLGEFDPTVLKTPTAIPDPCLFAVSDLNAALPFHVQGYSNSGATPPIACLSDIKLGTDILIIRRASTCIAGIGDCDSPLDGVPYFQASLCTSLTQLRSNNVADFYSLDTALSNFNRLQQDCATKAALRRYYIHIYFIANNDSTGDGIPTLKRLEVGSKAGAIGDPVPLVEGIENLKLEYGIDATNSGTPSIYSVDPGLYNSCTGVTCGENWRNVTSVKVILLAKNTKPTPGYNDTKTYQLGTGVANRFGPFNDTYKRHVYQAAVQLRNVSQRREK